MNVFMCHSRVSKPRDNRWQNAGYGTPTAVQGGTALNCTFPCCLGGTLSVRFCIFII